MFGEDHPGTERKPIYLLEAKGYRTLFSAQIEASSESRMPTVKQICFAGYMSS